RRLAAQERPVEGRQQGWPRRRRGPDRGYRQREGGGDGGGQLRDRFRRPQRAVPGHGAQHHRASAASRQRRDQAAGHAVSGRIGDGGGSRQGNGRHHRREHDRASYGGAVGRRGLRGGVRAQQGHRWLGQDRRGGGAGEQRRQ